MLDDAELDRWREAAEDALLAARDNAEAGWHNWAYPDALPGGTPRARYQASDAAQAREDASTVIAAVDRASAALRAET